MEFVSINKKIELHKQGKPYSINLLNFTLEINEITIPHGLEANLINLLSECAINYSIIDNRINGRKINISFKGELKEKQQLAFEEMNKFDNGVLSVTTGFGKTVIGARIIAEKKTSTLILVHIHIPVLERMYHKRLTAYRSVGYSIKSNAIDSDTESGIYDDSDYFEHVMKN